MGVVAPPINIATCTRRCASEFLQPNSGIVSAGSGFRLAAMEDRKEETGVYKPVASWNTDDVVAWIRGTEAE